jgi:hypothetical protein
MSLYSKRELKHMPPKSLGIGLLIRAMAMKSKGMVSVREKWLNTAWKCMSSSRDLKSMFARFREPNDFAHEELITW